jgi:hypothetical protein
MLAGNSPPLQAPHILLWAFRKIGISETIGIFLHHNLQ